MRLAAHSATVGSSDIGSRPLVKSAINNLMICQYGTLPDTFSLGLDASTTAESVFRRSGVENLLGYPCECYSKLFSLDCGIIAEDTHRTNS